MSSQITKAAVFCALALAGCDGPVEKPSLSTVDGDGVQTDGNGHCLHSTTTPAVFETVTEQVIDQPAVVDENGNVIEPAVFHSITRQNIVREREEVSFSIPCPSYLTADVIATLQRALIARGYYNGPINGQMDDRLRAAIRHYQQVQGDVDTDVLTLRSAQALGIVAIPRDQLQ